MLTNSTVSATDADILVASTKTAHGVTFEMGENYQ
jgi:hypothetical protein